MDHNKIMALADAVSKGYDVEFDSDDEARAVAAALSGAGGGSGQDTGAGGSTEQPSGTDVQPSASPLVSFAAGVAHNLPFATRLSPIEKLRSDRSDGVWAASKHIDELEHSADQHQADNMGMNGPYGGDTGRQKPELPMSYNQSSAVKSNPGTYLAGSMAGKLPEMIAQSKALSPFAAADRSIAELPMHGPKNLSKEYSISKTKASAMDAMVARGMNIPESEISKMSANQRYQDALQSLAGDFDLETAQGVLGIAEPWPDVPALGEYADAARANASFPYSLGGIGRSIDEKASAASRPGSLANPDIRVPTIRATELPSAPAARRAGWTPQPGQPKEISFGPSSPPERPYANVDSDLAWMSTSPEEMNSILPAGPAASSRMSLDPGRLPRSAPREPQSVDLQMPSEHEAPLSPVLRSARDRAFAGSDKGADAVLAPGGLQQTTPVGAGRNILMRKLPMMIGMQKDKIAKMKEILSKMPNSPITGPSLAGKALLGRLIDSFADAKDQYDASAMDYLYKEMYPDYNSLSMAAEKAGQE